MIWWIILGIIGGYSFVWYGQNRSKEFEIKLIGSNPILISACYLVCMMLGPISFVCLTLPILYVVITGGDIE